MSFPCPAWLLEPKSLLATFDACAQEWDKDDSPSSPRPLPVDPPAPLVTLASRPQHLPLVYWERVFSRGGWALFGWDEFDQQLFGHEWYRADLSAKLNTVPGQAMALKALSGPILHGAWDWGKWFHHALASASPSWQCTLVDKVSQAWCARPLECDSDMSMVATVYTTMAEAGVDMSATSWPTWWGQRLVGLSPVGALQLLPAMRLARAQDSKNSPPGLIWTPDIAFGVGQALGHHLLPSPEDMQVGFHPTHERAHVGLFELVETMESWGLHRPLCEAALEQGVVSVCPRAREVLIAATPSLERSTAFMAQRARWESGQRSRLLAEHLPAHAPASRPILRF